MPNASRLVGANADRHRRRARTQTVIGAAVNPILETVEPRRHLSASVVNGVLTIVGTPSADNYNISYNGSTYTVLNNNVSEGRFSSAGITGITYDLGDGNDVVYTGAMAKPCTVWGGDGDDNISTNNSATVVDGGDGNDSIVGGNANDNLNGGAGNDTLVGGTGNDTLAGSDGDDSLSAGNGNDNVDGGDGNDWMWGDNNTDTLHGGDGDDYIKLDNGADDIYGDGGADTYDATSAGSGNAVNVSLDDVKNDFYTLNTNDKDNVHSDIEVLVGSNGNDTLTGSANADVINGGNGNDSILGLAGNDTLDGGAGNDTLRGGDDNDDITGGNGNDSLFGDAGDDSLHAADFLGFDMIDGGTGTNTADYDLFDLVYNIL